MNENYRITEVVNEILAGKEKLELLIKKASNLGLKVEINSNINSASNIESEDALSLKVYSITNYVA